MEKQQIKAIDTIDINPRCLAALPSNIDELVYIFKTQDQHVSGIQNSPKKSKKTTNKTIV